MAQFNSLANLPTKVPTLYAQFAKKATYSKFDSMSVLSQGYVSVDSSNLMVTLGSRSGVLTNFNWLNVESLLADAVSRSTIVPPLRKLYSSLDISCMLLPTVEKRKVSTELAEISQLFPYLVKSARTDPHNTEAQCA